MYVSQGRPHRSDHPVVRRPAQRRGSRRRLAAARRPVRGPHRLVAAAVRLAGRSGGLFRSPAPAARAAAAGAGGARVRPAAGGPPGPRRGARHRPQRRDHQPSLAYAFVNLEVCDRILSNNEGWAESGPPVGWRKGRAEDVSHHPVTATLERFAAGDLPSGEARGVVEHLLRGCRECRRQVAERAPFLADGWLDAGDSGSGHAGDVGDVAGGGGGAGSGAELEAAYDEAIRRAIDGVLLHGDRVLDHKARTRRLLAILRRTSGVTEHRLTPHRGRRLPLYEAYLARSWELRFENPQRMVVFARLACRLARDLGEDGY